MRRVLNTNGQIVLVSLLLMAAWYVKSPFGSLWLNGGDAWADGAILTSVENAKRIPWSESVYFPIRGIAVSMDSVSLIPELGYAYVYTHWPSGYEWAAFALDWVGISSLVGMRLIMVAMSLLGLALWARVWSLWSHPKLGALFFGIAGLSYWYLSWSPTLGYWVSYVVFLSGLQLWLWTKPGSWHWRRLIGAWLLLLLTSLFSLQLIPWSFVVLGGLVFFRLIGLTWRMWLLLMTAPILGMGSLFLRLHLLSSIYGLGEISSKFLERTSWLQYLTSIDYYALLALRLEYYLGIGIILLIAGYCLELIYKRKKRLEIDRFYYLWGIVSLGGIAWWIVFPQSNSEHPQMIVLASLAQSALWAMLLYKGLRFSFFGTRINMLVTALLAFGLLARLGIGYFNQIVPIPNKLAENSVSGVCATDGVMVPAVQTLLGTQCPNVGAKRLGGDNLSWELDNCQGQIREGVFVHFSHVPRVNLPGLDGLYMVYDRWRNSENNNPSSPTSEAFSVPGQPDAPVLWQEGPVSWYEPVHYCVQSSHDLW